MSASYFIDIFPGSRLANVYLPEWGIEYKDLDGKDLESLSILEIDDYFKGADEVIENIKEVKPDIVYFTGYLQKIFLFGDPKFWSQKFANKEKTNIVFSENEILINIRTKELLQGLWQYPILPVEFIKKIVRETKLEPIFVGQIEDNAYCDELKENFPYARYINHVSPLFDFEVLRSSKNSLVAISTFSFLANWLSECSKIILPVYGFYNFPASHGAIDLLPIDDSRFVFYLLPFIGGISEAKMRSISEEISIRSFKISGEALKSVKSRFLSFKENNDDTYVNDTWYLSRYLDASIDIARGFYQDSKDHFLRRGMWEGKIPDHPKNEDKKVISLNKIAMISSTSEYDVKHEEEDFAKKTVDSSAVERYSFHTSREVSPWLEIDLEKVYKICRIDIYNRDCNDLVRNRCIPLYVYGSEKKISWHLVHVENNSFGGSYNNHLTIHLYPNVSARFVKITTPNDDCLHLKKVHVYGE
ncbi:discoidin domain-containing protein [Gluconobacter sp. OJB]|uniref:discoidin domain-containing protein n=1 Tax=Gluconobacter sp. OJB TaxID=3145196 RepID=UPI0031F8DA1F